MAQLTAQQKLDAVNARVKANTNGRGSTELPADYSALIKAALAERAASQTPSPQQAAPQQRNSQNNGVSNANGKGGNAARNVPAPSPAPAAPNTPIPTRRPGDDANSSQVAGGMDWTMLVGALGLAGAAEYIRRKMKGQPTDDIDAKLQGQQPPVTEEGGEAGKQSRLLTSQTQDAAPLQRQPLVVTEVPQGTQVAPAEDDILDAMYEELGRTDPQITDQTVRGQLPPPDAPAQGVAAPQQPQLPGSGGAQAVPENTLNQMIDQLLQQQDEIAPEPKPRVRVKAGSVKVKPKV